MAFLAAPNTDPQQSEAANVPYLVHSAVRVGEVAQGGLVGWAICLFGPNSRGLNTLGVAAGSSGR